jgi:C_GCAxxG_C_C family probable redox protein
MTDRKEKAMEFHKKGLNCAQAVLGAFAADFNFDEKTAFKIACGFGAGMGRLQYTCGAVTGAIMVLGLKHGNISEGETYLDIKKRTYEAVRHLADEFKKKHNALGCMELLGLNLNDEAQFKEYKDRNLSVTICEKCIVDAVSILEEML